MATIRFRPDTVAVPSSGCNVAIVCLQQPLSNCCCVWAEPTAHALHQENHHKTNVEDLVDKRKDRTNHTELDHIPSPSKPKNSLVNHVPRSAKHIVINRLPSLKPLHPARSFLAQDPEKASDRSDHTWRLMDVVTTCNWACSPIYTLRF